MYEEMHVSAGRTARLQNCMFQEIQVLTTNLNLSFSLSLFFFPVPFALFCRNQSSLLENLWKPLTFTLLKCIYLHNLWLPAWDPARTSDKDLHPLNQQLHSASHLMFTWTAGPLWAHYVWAAPISVNARPAATAQRKQRKQSKAWTLQRCYMSLPSASGLLLCAALWRTGQAG